MIFAPLVAARRATAAIPIVAISGRDPVSEGWAQSLARPGGNVTGLTVTFPELGGKRLELLAEAVPRLSRVALLYAPTDLSDAKEQVAGMDAMARQLGMQLQAMEVGAPADLEAAFTRVREWRVQGCWPSRPASSWPVARGSPRSPAPPSCRRSPTSGCSFRPVS
jgi:putative ABC transport system substrate-binding protein